MDPTASSPFSSNRLLSCPCKRGIRFFSLAEQSSDPFIDAGFLLGLPWVFCFPWSLVLFVLATSGVLPESLGEYSLPIGIVVIAILIYGVGKAGRLREIRDGAES